MKIVILDGWTTNPGDLSWEELETLGELTVYDRTDHQNLAGIVERIGGAEAVLTNKTPSLQDTKSTMLEYFTRKFSGIKLTYIFFLFAYTHIYYGNLIDIRYGHDYSALSGAIHLSKHYTIYSADLTKLFNL